MTVGMLGRKVGMMRVYDGAGRVRPVTAIELGPNRVTQLRTNDRDGYEAVQVGYSGDRKRVTRSERGHLREAGVDEALTLLREVKPDGSDFTLGQELLVDQYTPGEYIDVTGTSKGRGFAGGVKRWNFKGGPATHGAKKHRGPGSVGAGTYPGKTWKGQKMGGHMGARRKTVRNLLVVQIDVGRNLILVQGSVPGPNGGLVSIQPAARNPLADYEAPEPFAPDENAVVAAPSAEVDETPDDTVEDTVVDEAAVEETAADDAADEAPVDEVADEAPADDAEADSDSSADSDDDEATESEEEQA
jgi:large subunit ribosomal protein L3